MRTVQQIAESGAAWLTEDELKAIVGEVLSLRAERDALAKRVEEMEAGRDAARARVIREVVEKLANREVPGVIVSVRITNDAGLTGGWDDPESVRVVLLGALVEMIP